MATLSNSPTTVLKSIFANGTKTPDPLSETPFTTFVQLDGKSSTPSQFRTPDTFTIIRLQSQAGLTRWLASSGAIPSWPAHFLLVQERADFSGANSAEATLR